MAVEAALGDRLGAIVVDNHEASAGGVAFLKGRREGRSSFVALSAVAASAELGAAPDAPGVRGRLVDHVRFAAEPSR